MTSFAKALVYLLDESDLTCPSVKVFAIFGIVNTGTLLFLIPPKNKVVQKIMKKTKKKKKENERQPYDFK